MQKSFICSMSITVCGFFAGGLGYFGLGLKMNVYFISSEVNCVGQCGIG